MSDRPLSPSTQIAAMGVEVAPLNTMQTAVRDVAIVVWKEAVAAGRADVPESTIESLAGAIARRVRNDCAEAALRISQAGREVGRKEGHEQGYREGFAVGVARAQGSAWAEGKD